MKEEISYSDDFQTFLKDQVMVWRTDGGKDVSITSRLESRLFTRIMDSKPISEEKIRQTCRKIFDNLNK